MTEEKEFFMTEEGFKNIEAELDELKTVKRKEIAGRIKQALEFGDLSENSEYDQAKNDQSQVEERILKLENMLVNAKIIEDEEISKGTVGVGSHIEICDVKEKENFEVTIVGSAEADPFNGKISNVSPVGQALIGHKAKEIVDVHTPDGVIKYKIVKIF